MKFARHSLCLGSACKHVLAFRPRAHTLALLTTLHTSLAKQQSLCTLEVPVSVAPPDGFKLVIEYGPSFREYGEQHGGKVRLPKALATLELAWTSEDSEAEVVERLAQVGAGAGLTMLWADVLCVLCVAGAGRVLGVWSTQCVLRAGCLCVGHAQCAVVCAGLQCVVCELPCF